MSSVKKEVSFCCQAKNYLITPHKHLLFLLSIDEQEPMSHEIILASLAFFFFLVGHPTLFGILPCFYYRNKFYVVINATVLLPITEH